MSTGPCRQHATQRRTVPIWVILRDDRYSSAEANPNNFEKKLDSQAVLWSNTVREWRL